MKCRVIVVLILLFVVSKIARAQSSTEDRGSAQETQVRGYWVDPSTGLMWAGKDNGKDVSWRKAMKYCHDLRLAAYSDWRLATIDELQGIYDKRTSAPGKVGAGKYRGDSLGYKVKGNVFLTGSHWSSTLRIDDRGRTIGIAAFFDFVNGNQQHDDAGWFGGIHGRRALCVRRPTNAI